MNIPTTYDGFRQYWATNQQAAIIDFTSNNYSFIPNLLPEQAIQMPTVQLIYLLEKRFGQANVFKAISPQNTIPSPIINNDDSQWLKTVNMVGINVRTIGSFWNVVKYCLTIPKAQSSVHLLPIWECGVVASLYGMASWNINPEFFDDELANHFPQLDSVEKQLKVVCNLLHLMGKTVGMDIIPHTDRYSEIVLANPHYFEWLQRKEFEIIDHAGDLHEKIQHAIIDFLYNYGATISEYYPREISKFFDNDCFSEEKRLFYLFGAKQDLAGRTNRRNQLINHLFYQGFEPVPATMAPPYRGLKVDVAPEAKTVDSDGRIWRDYVITKPEPMSRVFGPLTRYKLFDSKHNNQDWEIDFNQPKPEVWAYAAKKYQAIAHYYNFDFMRGDMSHVQMRPEGTPKQIDQYYDIHQHIKQVIAAEKPYFGYFAESFLAPPNTMAYGIEEEHLEASEADSTLGDLQSMVVGSQRFIAEFARYHQLLVKQKFAPNFTVMTADKDDPRFDSFYLQGNELRMFIALFLTDMPSYTSLGFEQRDLHPYPAPNEHYTKLYVFQLDKGEKATHGKYQWGKNGTLFRNLTILKQLSDEINPTITGKKIQWLIPPDPQGNKKILAWTQVDLPTYTFVLNLDTQEEFNISNENIALDNINLIFSNFDYNATNKYLLKAGEYKIFKH